MNTGYRSALQGAFLTALTLFGGMLAGLVVGTVVTELLPGHSGSEPSALGIILGIIPAISGLVAGGAGWGIAMGRFVDHGNRRRMALAGVLGFVPITIVLAIGLFGLEQVFRENAQLPVHKVFTLLFVPSAFIIAGITAWTLGRALRDAQGRALAWRLLWQVGLGAALAFLLVSLTMEAAGWVVGAPGAAARNTMITVLMAGNLGVALVGGGIVGLSLEQRKRERISY